MPLQRTRLLPTARSAVSFNGVNQYVEVPTTVVTPGSTSLTVLAWASFNAIPYEVQMIVKQGYGYVNGAYYIYTQYEKYYRAVLRGTDGVSITLPGVVVYPSTWYFLGLRYDGSEVSLWINAEKRISASFSSPIGVNEPTRIGHPYGISGIYLNGLVSGVLIYSRALTGEEILWNYYYPDNPVRNGLVLWLHYDTIDTANNKWYDKSGFGNHATLYNNPEKVDMLLPPKRTLSPTRTLTPTR